MCECVLAIKTGGLDRYFLRGANQWIKRRVLCGSHVSGPTSRSHASQKQHGEKKSEREGAEGKRLRVLKVFAGYEQME